MSETGNVRLDLPALIARKAHETAVEIEQLKVAVEELSGILESTRADLRFWKTRAHALESENLHLELSLAFAKIVKHEDLEPAPAEEREPK